MNKVTQGVDAGTLNREIDEKRRAALCGATSHMTSFDAPALDTSPRRGVTAQPTGRPIGDDTYPSHDEGQTSS